MWGESLSSGRRWRLIAFVLAGLLALALFGLIHLGSQPKTIPYIVEVNKLGEVAYAGRLDPAQADSNVIRASIASFISDLRLVTPDAGLQAEAVNRVYAYISKGDPALGRVNSFYGATKEASPYIRAQDEIVSVQIDDVLPTSRTPGKSIGPKPRATARAKKRCRPSGAAWSRSCLSHLAPLLRKRNCAATPWASTSRM